MKRTLTIFLCLFCALCAFGNIKVKKKGNEISISNNKISLRLTKGENLVSLSYFLEGKKYVGAQLKVLPESGEKFLSFKSFNIKNKSPNEALIEAFCPNDSALTFKLKKDSPFIEMELGDSTKGIALKMNSEALVIPDLETENDLVFYPPKQKKSFQIPTDSHFLMQMLDKGNAMLMVAWPQRNQNVECGTINGKNGAKSFVKILSGKNKKIWTGIIAAPGVWHRVKKELSIMEAAKLDWKAPFFADWRATMFRKKGVIDLENNQSTSWIFAQKQKDGKFLWRHFGLCMIDKTKGKMWMGGRGTFIYNCYTDENNFGHLGFLKSDHPKKPDYQGDVKPLIYSTKRAKNTPKDVLLPIGALNQFLGKKEVDSISSGKKHYRGPATCDSTKRIEKIFYREQEQEEKEKIKKELHKMNLFVEDVRVRVNEYMDWLKEMNVFLDETEKKNPELKKLVEGFKRNFSEMEWAYAEKKERIKSPDYCKALSGKILKLIDDNIDEEEKEERCKKICRDIRTMGGGQDSLIASFRMINAAIRQNAGLMITKTKNHNEIDFLKTIRKKTAKILHYKRAHEGK